MFQLRKLALKGGECQCFRRRPRLRYGGSPPGNASAMHPFRALRPVLALCLLAAAAAGASGFRFLVEDETLCADDERLCIRGSLSYEPNPRLVDFRGRVTATAEPGEFVLVLVGHQRDGTRRYAEMRLAVKGKYSEVVSQRMIPDWPDIDDWALDHVAFRPAPENRR